MENPIQPIVESQPKPNNWSDRMLDSDDEAAENLFNEISLSEEQPKAHEEIENPFQNFDPNIGIEGMDEEVRTPKKLKKLKNKLNNDRSMSKKQLKRMKKKQKKEKKRLKRLQKQSDKKQKKGSDREDWSGEDEEEDDDDLSSDSLFANLNPKKRKHLNHNISPEKKRMMTEKKEGFALNELGIDAEVKYSKSEDELSDGSSYSEKRKRGRKVKKEKKQISKNMDILKELINQGLCVDEEEDKYDEEGVKREIDYDNGLDQLNYMKGGSKKKGPKIANKMFQDISLNDMDQKFDPLPEQLELAVDGKVQRASSMKVNSFLERAERLKKFRGMDSDLKSEDYSKLISEKARDSIVKLIKQRQFDEAEEIELDIKVPEIIKGRSSTELNNSMYFRRFSSTASDSKNSPQPERKMKVEEQYLKKKISREQIFKEMNDEAKNRRSKDITHQTIKNSFKVTQLEEIEETRKKNEEKRRKQAMYGSDDEEDYEEEEREIMKNLEGKEQVFEVRLGFMDRKIDEDAENKQVIEEKAIKEIDSANNGQNINIMKKTESLEIEEPLDDLEYKKLLELEEGIEENEVAIEQQIDDEEGEQEGRSKVGNNSQQNNQSQKEQKQDDQFVDQDVSKEGDKFRINLKADERPNEDFQEQGDSSSEELQEKADSEMINEEDEEQEQRNKRVREQMEEQGINIKKNRKIFEEEELGVSNQSKEEIARKEFKKLRKIAEIIKIKKKKEKRIQMAGQFFEEEAEEGSDNEDHDHEVKKINYNEEEKEYEGLDLDAELEELIDNAVDIDEQNEELAFRKYMEDVKLQDREELKKIMRGEFKRRNDNEAMLEEIQEDEKNRLKRMEDFEKYMKEKEEQEGKELYMNEPQERQDDDDSQKQPKQEKEEFEVVDEFNEENLKKYFDDCLVDTKTITQLVIKPQKALPQSVQRGKKNEKRNTMRAKEEEELGSLTKIKKKTSSHLNEIFMKNKEKPKPISFIRNFGLISKR